MMRSWAYNCFGVLMGTSWQASGPRWPSLRGDSWPMIILFPSQGDFCATAFDRNLVIDERTRRVARWVSDFLKHSGDRLQKTIVFCVDTEHAARMRQALLNENTDLARQNPRYVMRITGDDAEGVAQLGNFIDPEAIYPVIITTSRVLSTGVDAQTCRLIVLD